MTQMTPEQAQVEILAQDLAAAHVALSREKVRCLQLEQEVRRLRALAEARQSPDGDDATTESGPDEAEGH